MTALPGRQCDNPGQGPGPKRETIVRLGANPPRPRLLPSRGQANGHTATNGANHGNCRAAASGRKSEEIRINYVL